MADFDETLNNILGNPDAMAQIMQLAQSLSGSESQGSVPLSSSSQAVPPPTVPPDQNDFFSSLTGNFDPQLLMRLLPVVQELGRQENTNARQLLYALRPYLKKERQDHVDRALQLAKLFHLGKKFLSGWEA